MDDRDDEIMADILWEEEGLHLAELLGSVDWSEPLRDDDDDDDDRHDD